MADAAGASPPLQYWLLWMATALVLLLLFSYVLKGRRIDAYEGSALASIVSALALVVFAMATSETVTEYAKHHEPPVASAGRFIFLVLAAFLLVYYAVEGRHDH